MEHETQQQGNPSNPTADQNAALINSFIEITSSSKEEALFFLESHQWDLDASVSTFFDSNSTAAQQPRSIAPPVSGAVNNSPTSSPSDSADYSPSQSPSRSRSPSPARPSRPPYTLRSRRNADKKPSGSDGSNARGVRTLADLNRSPPGGSDSDSDEGQDYFTGGEKSGMVVRDPSKHHDVDSIFNQARQAGAVEGSDYIADRVEKVAETIQRLEQGDLKLRVQTLEAERAFQRVNVVQKTIGSEVSFSLGNIKFSYMHPSIENFESDGIFDNGVHELHDVHAFHVIVVMVLMILKDFLLWVDKDLGPWGPLVMVVAYFPFTLKAFALKAIVQDMAGLIGHELEIKLEEYSSGQPTTNCSFPS
ncbi:uncharacterized protein LOC120198777 [Hibiscus syriacus]|uniref:uncharacterized protein LOC120198777 n=1 Tax=Hibiscus syriacus TaxID=106335 RepID=UPI001924E96F|nr:uncharacterized protein LOC120198777 [Hibiscus syriacus]